MTSDKADLSSLDLKIYRRAGLSDAEAQEWADAGIRPYEAEGYTGAELELPDALKWRDAGIGGFTSRTYVAAGLSIDSAKKWQASGLSIAEIADAITHGKSPTRAKADARALRKAQQAAERHRRTIDDAAYEAANDAIEAVREVHAQLLRQLIDVDWGLGEGHWDNCALAAYGALAGDGGHTHSDGEEQVSVTLYLRVEFRDDGQIVWDVSMSEEDSGFGEPCIADGEADSIEEAKNACMRAAAEIAADTW